MTFKKQQSIRKSLTKKWMALSAFISTIISVVLGKLIGLFHANYPPFAELTNVNQLIEKSVGNSFPSDHTIIITALCVTFFLADLKPKLLWLILIPTVGVSRIWVGVHYPVDVIVSVGIGTVVTFIVHKNLINRGVAKARKKSA